MSGGKIIIFAAPSGSGKTTLVKNLLKNNTDLGFSISATTRDKRDYEIDGKDYYFLNVEQFTEKIAKNEFVEWEEVYNDKFYGTLRSEIDRIWALGKNVIFDLDVQGGINLKKLYNEKALSIFVKLPSMDVLVERLKNRKTETEDSFLKRITKAKDEMAFESYFDKVIMNEDLETSYKESQKIYDEFVK